VRVFAVPGPDKKSEYLSPQVLIGNFEIFKAGDLVVQSPPGGWADEEQSRVAVLQLLSVVPGDPGLPSDFFDAFTHQQVGFLKDCNPEIKLLARQRFES
jgi:hypothetical protein